MIAAREYSLFYRYGEKVHRRPKIIKHAIFLFFYFFSKSQTHFAFYIPAPIYSSHVSLIL